MRLFLTSSLVLVSAFSAFGQTAVAVQPAAGTGAERAAAFKQVWTTVNEKHYDPTFGGVDWKKVRADYEPRALAPGLTDTEFHDVLRRMLGELKLSHFGIHPPTAEMVAVGKTVSAYGYASTVEKDEMRAERITVDGKTVEMR